MTLLLIDAMNLIRRIYAAQPQNGDAIEQTLLLSQNAILKDIEKVGASHVACVFDGKGPTWRHSLYPAYKADRKPMPEELAGALENYMAHFKGLGIASMVFDEYEADDVIATLAVKTSLKGGQVTIVSTDKGFMQIADQRIRLYHHFDKRFLNEDDVQQQLGLQPHQLVDFLSLVGDTTNHVPGIAGIGPKTAGQLLDEYGDLDQILIHSESIKGKVGNSLQQDYRVALLARILVRLKTDCHLELNLQNLRYRPLV
ncbi:flap endonuclease Xni [Oceaniserpentilla sp. 4NH20-0058]|uniref:flap endonuclease Xni n=1 Tax=Oceaniserpentilla sp. 4NH20-0058 TaxID=3127660 RepID=UPI003103C00D